MGITTSLAETISISGVAERKKPGLSWGAAAIVVEACPELPAWSLKTMRLPLAISMTTGLRPANSVTSSLRTALSVGARTSLPAVRSRKGPVGS